MEPVIIEKGAIMLLGMSFLAIPSSLVMVGPRKMRSAVCGSGLWLFMGRGVRY